jgi:hypothetical protein
MFQIGALWAFPCRRSNFLVERHIRYSNTRLKSIIAEFIVDFLSQFSLSLINKAFTLSAACVYNAYRCFIHSL